MRDPDQLKKYRPPTLQKVSVTSLQNNNNNHHHHPGAFKIVLYFGSNYSHLIFPARNSSHCGFSTSDMYVYVWGGD